MATKQLLAGLLAGVALASCEKDNATSSDPTGLAIQVLITPSSAAISVGQKVTLHATVTGPAGTDQGIIWQSLTDSIVTVTSVGVVTGVASGAGVIKCAWFDDPTTFATVSVQVTAAVQTDTTGNPSIRRAGRLAPSY